MSDKKVLRLSRHRVLGGVCAGFAEYYGIEPLFVRLFYIVTTSASAIVPGIVIYLVLWALMRPAE
jgi:phage shock protein PspC (stress-responsive transcriptional regulator)